MKIECDKCGAKYSIADEKVKGKTFKIRCKKCSNAIIVRDKPKAEEPEAPADEDVDDGWHVGIGDGDDTIGPISDDEVRAKFASGEIDASSVVWKEGFEDWVALSEVDDFADLVAAGADIGDDAGDDGDDAGHEDAAASDAGDEDAGDDAGDEDAGGDSGEDAGGDSGEDASNEDASDEDDTSLGALSAGVGAGAGGLGFGTGGDSGFGASSGFDDALSSKPEPEPEPEPEPASLTGQRNENSVLFSLDNLSAMASGGGGAAPAAASGGGGGGVAPTSDPTKIASAAPMSEGSGLIDIRALGAVLDDSKSAASSDSGDDELGGGDLGGGGGSLMGFGDGAGFGGLAALPLEDEDEEKEKAAAAAAAAATAAAQKSNKGMLIGIAAVFLLLLVGGGFLFNKMQSDAEADRIAREEAAKAEEEERRKAEEEREKKAAEERELLMKQIEELKAAGKGDEAAALAAKSAGDAEAAAGSDTGSKTGSTTRKSTRKKSGSSSASATDDALAPTPTKSAPKKPANSADDVDCLLDPTLPKCGGSKKKSSTKSTTSTASNLPAKLTAKDLMAGISKVKSAAKACGPKNGVSGVKIPVKLSIKGSTGKVISAKASGEYAGKPVAKCIEGALSKASFDKFSATQQGFKYNVKL